MNYVLELRRHVDGGVRRQVIERHRGTRSGVERRAMELALRHIGCSTQWAWSKDDMAAAGDVIIVREQTDEA